jgi:hypothetical protein
MMARLGLLVISFGWVFVQAFQSRNVNSGQYLWAACGSWAIGNLQSAMWVHRRFPTRKVPPCPSAAP